MQGRAYTYHGWSEVERKSVGAGTGSRPWALNRARDRVMWLAEVTRAKGFPLSKGTSSLASSAVSFDCSSSTMAWGGTPMVWARSAHAPGAAYIAAEHPAREDQPGPGQAPPQMHTLDQAL